MKPLKPTLSKLLISILLLSIAQISFSQDYVWAPDFPIGSTIPVLQAPDQNGAEQNLESLTGDKGLVLVFNRSFDWCPFCKAQLVGLVDVGRQLEALGLPVVTITYDPVATLKLVEEDEAVYFSMLHDEEVKHVDAYGIRNMDYAPGEFGYGIPEPGIMLINPEGVIQYKFAEENFRERPDFADILEAAENM